MRIPRDTYYMMVAKLTALRSTCAKIKVGCVIVNHGNIVSIGYNGTPPGSIHCEEHFNDKLEEHGESWVLTNEFKEQHALFSARHEMHAELNAITAAAKAGIALSGSVLYVTYSPCLFCAKAIVHTGIKKVIYEHLYDREDSLSFLVENNIELSTLDVGNLHNFLK